MLQVNQSCWAKLFGKFPSPNSRPVVVELFGDNFQCGRVPLDAPEKFAFTKNNCKFSLLLRISRQQFTIRRQFSTKSINMNPAYITADSSNGLFVNGEKLNRGETRILPFNSKINLSPADRLFTFIDYRADTGLDFPIGLDKHFFIGDILGKGGFGCVRLAFEVETGKKFALKIIRRKLSFSGELERKQHLEQLKNEVDIMRFCSSHPNLVRFYYSAETDTSLFLFMEFVDGCDLSRYVCENSHVPEDDCKFIAYQICKGLEALHAQNIAHRDIKLENIFLSFLPGVLVAKIGDYSFSKYDYNLTTTLGTDFYIPPEVLNSNSEHVYSGAKADIWSLGCLFYALLSQKAPFRSKVDCPPVEDQIQNAYLSFDECIWKKITYSARSMIESIIVVDTCKRPTVQQLLHNVWFTDPILLPRIEELYSLLENNPFANDTETFTELN